jgi:hypothetical protein
MAIFHCAISCSTQRFCPVFLSVILHFDSKRNKINVFVLCFASNYFPFCFDSLPIFSVRFKVRLHQRFFASFHFPFCYIMKQNENGYRLEKLKYDLKGTEAWEFPPLAFIINRPYLGSCIIYFIILNTVSNSPSYSNSKLVLRYEQLRRTKFFLQIPGI